MMTTTTKTTTVTNKNENYDQKMTTQLFFINVWGQQPDGQ